jgi:pimeloyl-ACP methyl ester carboxylesterase
MGGTDRRIAPRGKTVRRLFGHEPEPAQEQEGKVGTTARHASILAARLTSTTRLFISSSYDNLVVLLNLRQEALMKPDHATIAGVRHETAPVNGTRLHYVTAGDRGTPVLLVHGFPETWWAFRKLIPLLAAHHRVYAVDLRGFGDSDVADESYSGAVAAEDLHTLIEYLSLGPMHVVGQDVSGGVVYRLAATHPEDVISLTAVESGLAGFGAEGLADVTHGGVWYIGALAAPGVAGLLFEKEARAFVGEYLYPFFGVDSAAVSPEDVTEFARTYGRPGGFSGAVGLYRGMLTEGQELRTLAQQLPLRMPATTIGSRGGGFTHEAFRGVTTQEVSAIVLDGVGHYVAQEAPERLADILIETWSSSPGDR